MIRWTATADWMRFGQLSQMAGVSAAYTLGYKLTDKTDEPWTSRFVRFKSGDVEALYGASRLMYTAVPDLFAALRLKPAETVFIPALSSGETKANPERAIPFIAKGCATSLGVRFRIDALSKNVHKKIHSFYSVAERNAELDKAKYESKQLDALHVLVFDDFITRGDTLSRIALAVLAKNPKTTVYGVALAKNERVAYCPNPTNDQIAGRWNLAWRRGEQEANEPKRK